MHDSTRDEPEIEADHFDAAGSYIGSGPDNADPALTDETPADPEPEIDGPALGVGNEPYRSGAAE